jgi:hypothetical protein
MVGLVSMGVLALALGTQIVEGASVALTGERHVEDHPMDQEQQGAHSSEGLVKWLHKTGDMVGVDDIHVAQVGNPPHRGLLVQKDFAPGEAIFRVNFNSIMSAKGVETNETLQHVFQHFKSTPLLFWFLDGRPVLKPRLTLMMMVQRAMGAKSRWAPYIDSLPAEFSLLTEYNEEQLAELRGVVASSGSDLRKQVQGSIDELKREYNEMFPKIYDAFPELFNYKLPTYEDFRWARNAIDTRCFGFMREDHSRDIGMVPLADMANHGDVEVTWRTSADGHFEIYSLKPFQKGDEFVLNYGPRSNAYLLEHYGFLLPDNNHHEDPCDKGDYACIVKFLEKFDTTVRQDFEKLQDHTLSFNIRNAIQLRLEQRMHLLALDREESQMLVKMVA